MFPCVLRGRSALFLFFGRCIRISNMDHQVNEEIRDKELRLIGEDGAQLGIMSADEALEIAAQHDLDLVKISPNATSFACQTKKAYPAYAK